jgi:gliding motility-associated-like protein
MVNFSVISAADNCAGTVIISHLSDASTSGSCANKFTLTRTYRATDACGNYTDFIQNITVDDTLAPVITNLIGSLDITIACASDLPAVDLAAIAATDNCVGSVTISHVSDVTTAGSCANKFTVTRTYRATDVCGNQSDFIQTIAVNDTIAPIITCTTNITVNNDPGVCMADIQVPQPVIDENCSLYTLTNSKNQTSNASGKYTVGTTTIIWTATDECGNASSCLMTITVRDNENPVIICPENILACQNEPVILGVAAVTDNCGLASITNNAPSVFEPGATLVTWTATDLNGNTSSCNQTVTVNPLPVADAGQSNIVCNSETYTVQDASASNYSTILWTHDGLGSLENDDQIKTTYIPAFGETGTVNLHLTVTGLTNCGTSTDSLQLQLVPAATANAGNNISSCESAPVNLNLAQAKNFTSLLWLTSGTGVFNSTTILNPVYTPDRADISKGFVNVILQATGASPCGTAADTLRIDFIKAPLANAGLDESLCSISPYEFTTATANNYSSLFWTHNGSGSLSDPSVLRPTYTPGVGELGAIEFKLTAYGTSSCGNMVFSDLAILSIYNAMNVGAGADTEISAGSSTTLNGTISGGSGTYIYSWTPAEYLVNSNILNPQTIPLNEEKVFTLTILDLISSCSQSDSVAIKMREKPRPVAVDDSATTGMDIPAIIKILQNDIDPIGLGLDVSYISSPENGIVILNADGSVTYNPNSKFIGKDRFSYVICDRGTPSKCDTALVFIDVFDSRPALEIFNLVTPDGDGLNDNWYIRNIEEYPDNDVVILNRWGDILREFHGYNNTDNRWDGTNKKNEFLPYGVYYYIITIKDFDNFTGWIYLRGSK